MCNCNCKACQHCEARESKGHERKEAFGKSAFGVEHEEVSKLSLKPIQEGFKAMKFGNATSVPRAMSAGFQRGQKNGMGAVRSGLKGLQYGFRRSPGTFVAGGGAAIGGGSALMNRK